MRWEEEVLETKIWVMGKNYIKSSKNLKKEERVEEIGTKGMYTGELRG